MTPVRATSFDGQIKFGDCQNGNPIYLPCGRCTGCRNDLTKDWAVRCYHESQLHDYSCVLTLTFNDENLNSKFTLEKQDIQNFVKRLRQFIRRSKDLKQNYPQFYKQKISYLYCGEYGSNFQRPHYHLILFGFDFPDKKLLKSSDSGDKLYTSQFLDSLWGVGYSTIGSMSMASAMYCASYLTKYVSKIEQDEIYCGRLPEFGHASKKPAIGLNWLKKYHNDILAHDAIIINNQKYRIPRYYLKKLEELHPEKFTSLKMRRESLLDKSSPNWDDLHNKYVISMDKFKNTDTLKSSDNHKRLEYVKMLKARRQNHG